MTEPSESSQPSPPSAAAPAKQHVVFSGVQPSGSLHLGNYFGAISNWIRLQESYRCIYCIVDYHALTSKVSAEDLRRNTHEMALDLLACGVDPERAILFRQSDVPEHTELAWLLNCVTPFGDLTRMTQFKEKSDQMPKHVNAGLFTYPVLQAADILLYRATRVPVGEDQLQHLELTRTIARRYNNRFGELFDDVEPMLTQAARVMSLADPGVKMSKSLGDKHYVAVMEPEKSIRKKIATAVTDAGLGDAPDETSPGVANLFSLLRLTNAPQLAELEADYAARKLMYGTLKQAAGDAVCHLVRPMQERRRALAEQPERAREILAEGGRRARAIARDTIARARDLAGVPAATAD